MPVQAAFSVLAGFVAQAFEIEGWPVGLGLFAGLTVHTLLDFSNTLGVKLLAPFSRKRFCREWVFFIDACVVLLTFAAGALTLQSLLREGEVPPFLAVAFFAIMGVYFGAKGWLRRRAGRMAPEAITLIPSALWPWKFFGVTANESSIRRFQINAVTGVREMLSEHPILDAAYAGLLADIPEFRLMRELSPAYHVASALPTDSGEIVTCRDFRTRNFKTAFGDLEVLLDARKRLLRTTFHV